MKLIDRIIKLKEVPPFSSLAHQELCIIADIMYEKRLPKGSVLIKGKEIVDSFYVLLEGSLQEGEKNKFPHRIDIDNIQIFGVSSILFYKEFPADLIVKEDVFVLGVRKKHMFTITNEYPEFILELVKEQNYI